MTVNDFQSNRSEKWRLINSGKNDGAYNMALDESLLMSAGAKEQPITLRLYGWNPATLSLGFAQSYKDIDIDKLHGIGWGLVRRPTGGRAILHIDELTYSITSPTDEPPLNGSLLESYHLISRAILRALEFLGIQATNDNQYKPSTKPVPAPVCFETPSNYEITFGGRKLVGSAQARKYGGLLQHGSLPLFGDLGRINHVIKFNEPGEQHAAKNRLLEHATTLESILGSCPPEDTVRKAVARGFAETFEIDWIESQPTQEEMSRATELVRSKYATNTWTMRL